MSPGQDCGTAVPFLARRLMPVAIGWTQQGTAPAAPGTPAITKKLTRRDRGGPGGLEREIPIGKPGNAGVLGACERACAAPRGAEAALDRALGEPSGRQTDEYRWPDGGEG